MSGETQKTCLAAQYLKTRQRNFFTSNFNADGSLTWINLGLDYHCLHEDYLEQVSQSIIDWYQNLR